MKSFNLILFFLIFGTFSYSQNNTQNTSNEGSMKTVDLPEVVIRKAGKDFSVYLPDKNVDPSVKQLQQEFVAYNLGKDYEGYDSYLVILESEKGTLAASYDENGKLIRVVENYKNIRLPSAVIYSIYKAYPGWTIVNDKYLYSQEEGDITDKQYTIKIKKDNETRKLSVAPNGTIL